MIHPLALAFALTALPAAAQEYVEVAGLLSDEDFYRAVACAAEPGGACQKPFVRWGATRPVRVALREVDEAFIGRRAKVAKSAVTTSIRALNETRAGFRLAEVPADANAEIEIWFLGIARGDEITGTGIEGVDGTPVDEATTRVFFNHDTGSIERAAIVFSTSLSTADFQPAMLGELTRAMGLMTYVSSAAYTGVSVLARDSIAAAALGLQDIKALKRHYARN